MGDKATFPQRLEALRLDVNMLEEVRVNIPVTSEGANLGTDQHIIPNAQGKQGSLQVYATITTNDGYITPEGARQGLAVFGDELRADARANPGKHPNIDLLESIVNRNFALRCDVVRRNDLAMTERIEHVLHRAISTYGTPFILLDERGIKNTLQRINQAFSWNAGFKEFYAVKAFPNPHLLESMAEIGTGADCSEENELDKAEAAGILGEDKILTANNVRPELYRKAKEMGAIINLDDLTDIDFFAQQVGQFPEVMCVRFNPGRERVSGGTIFGNPEEQKYGMTRKQVFSAISALKERGVKRFGLHAMFNSNCLDANYHIGNAQMLLGLARDIKARTGEDVEFVNLGGGWGIGYRPEQRQLNPQEVGDGIKQAYEEIVVKSGLAPIKIFMENGRFITANHGWLVTTAIHEKHTYKEYIGVDATASDFARPAAYGAYHHLVVLGSRHDQQNQVYDVVGSLCENVDKFAVNRSMPQIIIGDHIALCGAGAHGRAMGSNYNDKPRCQELLFRTSGRIDMIRRAERKADLNATLDFRGSRFADLARR